MRSTRSLRQPTKSVLGSDGKGTDRRLCQLGYPAVYWQELDSNQHMNGSEVTLAYARVQRERPDQTTTGYFLPKRSTRSLRQAVKQERNRIRRLRSSPD
jgi:hypothetical protein